MKYILEQILHRKIYILYSYRSFFVMHIIRNTDYHNIINTIQESFIRQSLLYEMHCLSWILDTLYVDRRLFCYYKNAYKQENNALHKRGLSFNKIILDVDYVMLTDKSFAKCNMYAVYGIKNVL